MTDEPWRPLFSESGDAAAQYDALSEGVPPWLMSSLANWIQGQVIDGTREQSYVALRRIERELRWQMDWTIVQSHGSMTALLKVARTHEALLTVADYLVASTRSPNAPAVLGRLLTQAGSAWTVGERHGRPGLTRRVPEGVQASASAAFDLGNAGVLLRQAWSAIFGLHPNPSEAYRLAIKAVEAAAIPVVSPTNPRATLGTVIKQMEDQGTWSLPFDREHEQAPSSAVLVALLRMLWAGQHDRHAGAEDEPLTVSQPAAEAAVVAAVTLVQWFTSGAVARR